MIQLLPKTIEWVGDLNGHVQMIDQTLLPAELKLIQCHDVETMWEAIKTLRIRGAPAIGIAGAMALVLGVRKFSRDDEDDFYTELHRRRDYLADSRPTAINLFWALDRMVSCAENLRGAGVDRIKAALLAEARTIRDEDAASCRAIGRHGVDFIPEGAGVLTHCNAGGLATAEYGTALAVMYAAYEKGKPFRVYVGETRPLLQGARLTAWELCRAGIDVTTICDSMVGQVMKQGDIQCVITGADRIAANGDTANKIGTYGIAVLAKAHDIPFYVAAPTSTFDLSCQSGEQIPIEERDPDEIRLLMGRHIAPVEAKVYNPAFDVTPAHLIKAIITDRGVVDPVHRDQIAAMITS